MTRKVSAMNLRRTAVSVLLAVVAMVAAATPALAHTDLKSSDPAEGASLSAAPEKITLTFEEPVRLPPNPVTVTGPDGLAWTVGAATVAGAVVTAPVQPSGPAGQYTINYRVLSEDGDAVRGTVRFTMTAPATPATTSATTAAPTTTTQATAQPTTSAAAAPAGQPADAADGGVPVWVWILVAVVVLAGIGAALGIRGRRAEG
jgi:methionine-rich copper-binding protein CopC